MFQITFSSVKGPSFTSTALSIHKIVQIWSAEKPDTYAETISHPLKISKWCAISRRHIVGPMFFTNTVYAEIYRRIIKQFIALLNIEERDCIF